MLAEFDTLVVGAGPAAAATLIGLDQPGRLAVITGAIPGIGLDRKDIHAKILAAAQERQELAGVTEPIAIAGGSRPAFSTAAVGGLACYWGQQFIRYSSADPWPRAIFDRYDDYEACCIRIESEFQFDESNGPRGPNEAAVGHYRAYSPRLLVGTAENPTAGLLSMRQLIERKLTERGAETIEARVESLAAGDGCWEARLSNGSTVSSKRIILAAGVIGTASIMMRSFPELKSLRLSDHAPWMLYTYGMERLVRTTRKGPFRHFNVQTLARDSDGRTVLYATVYNMRYEAMNLILTALTGKSMAALAGMTAPWPANWIKPVQVWTASTTATVEIIRDINVATLLVRPQMERDVELAAFINTLREHGVIVLKMSQTSPLRGFHYYGLEVSLDCRDYIPAHHYLARRSLGKVLCVDGSVLQDIGCRPNTATAMAAALRIASRVPPPS